MLPFVAGPSTLTRSAFDIGRWRISRLFSFHEILIKTKLYLWNNEQKTRKVEEHSAKPEDVATQVYVPKLSESKLRELAWSLDIKERIAGGVAQNEEHVGGIISPVHTAKEALVR